jgi:hypothetical protein
MKITINLTEKEDLEFPKLMIEKKTSIIIIALYNKKGSIAGVVIYKNEFYQVGYTSYAWSSDNFIDFKGTITLENE